MTFQAYLDTIKEKTGKTSADFKILAKEKGLVKHGEIVAWLKSDYGLGHGHANAMTQVILHSDKPKVGVDEKIDKHFAGTKAGWCTTYDNLMETLEKFGTDVKVAPTSTYISIVRENKKFAILQVTAKRLDIGIKHKDMPTEGRYEAAGSWNAMVTHRVRIDDPSQIDDELISWLQQAYNNA